MKSFDLHIEESEKDFAFGFAAPETSEEMPPTPVKPAPRLRMPVLRPLRALNIPQKKMPLPPLPQKPKAATAKTPVAPPQPRTPTPPTPSIPDTPEYIEQHPAPATDTEPAFARFLVECANIRGQLRSLRGELYSVGADLAICRAHTLLLFHPDLDRRFDALRSKLGVHVKQETA